jgi:hypothetical protein
VKIQTFFRRLAIATPNLFIHLPRLIYPLGEITNAVLTMAAVVVSLPFTLIGSAVFQDDVVTPTIKGIVDISKANRQALAEMKKIIDQKVTEATNRRNDDHSDAIKAYDDIATKSQQSREESKQKVQEKISKVTETFEAERKQLVAENEAKTSALESKKSAEQSAKEQAAQKSSTAENAANTAISRYEAAYNNVTTAYDQLESALNQTNTEKGSSQSKGETIFEAMMNHIGAEEKLIAQKMDHPSKATLIEKQRNERTAKLETLFSQQSPETLKQVESIAHSKLASQEKITSVLSNSKKESEKTKSQTLAGQIKSVVTKIQAALSRPEAPSTSSSPQKNWGKDTTKTNNSGKSVEMTTRHP